MNVFDIIILYYNKVLIKIKAGIEIEINMSKIIERIIIEFAHFLVSNKEKPNINK
jgi:hypothetical protein